MAQPEKTFKQGCCSASVFMNSIRKDGKTMEISNVDYSRGVTGIKRAIGRQQAAMG